MRVTALGSGDAFCSAGRGHTCWLVDDARGAFAVDFGATALAALKRLGRDPDQIDAIHFTHLHGDHIGGWPFLLVDAVYRSQRRKPLLVTGPKGTGERLQALWAACYAAAAERPLPFAVEMHEAAVVRILQGLRQTRSDPADCLYVRGPGQKLPRGISGRQVDAGSGLGLVQGAHEVLSCALAERLRRKCRQELRQRRAAKIRHTQGPQIALRVFQHGEQRHDVGMLEPGEREVLLPGPWRQLEDDRAVGQRRLPGQEDTSKSALTELRFELETEEPAPHGRHDGHAPGQLLRGMRRQSRDLAK